MAPILTATNLRLAAILLLSVATAAGAWRNRPARGSRTLSLFVVAVAVMVAAHLLGHAADAVLAGSVEPAVETAAEKLQWLGIGPVAFLWFAFVLDYTEREHRLTRRGWAALLAWPAALNALIWVPDLGAAVGLDPRLAVYASLEAEGTLYWTHVGLSYALLAAGSVLVVSYVYRTNRVFRLQGAVVLVGLGAGWVGSVVTAFGLFGELHFHALQVGFLVMGIALFWGVFGEGLTDLTPVARSTIMEHLTAGVLVVDREGRVTDANPAARRILGREGVSVAGAPLSSVLADHPSLLSAIEGTTRTEDEVRIRTGDGERTLRVDVRPLERRGDRIGKAIVLYDITEQKRRQEELDLTKRVFSRLLRHNIRNDLNAVMGYADLITAEDVGGDRQMARSIFEITSALVDTSEKAREIEQVLELDDPGTEVDVVRAVRAAVESVRADHPGVAFRTDLPDRARAYAHVDLELAVENLVENAAVHNDVADPRVAVAVEADGEGVRIHVEDNGPGIPDVEVEAVRSGTEAPLEHGSGVGLHLVNWIVTAGDGDLRFEDTPEGTRVTVSLRPVPADETADETGGETTDETTDETADETAAETEVEHPA